MSGSKTPFDHCPDPTLGAALRAALAPGASADFVARVKAAAQARHPHSVEHHLACWARRGIAAAVVAALFAGFLIGRMRQTAEQSVADADQGAMIADGQVAEPNILFASNTGR